jgi:hydrogenase expression/formation protein HypC
MCLVLPSRVVALADRRAEIELPDGQRASVDVSVLPEVDVGDYVLVDRGLALRVIDAAEAETILAMYAEYSDLMTTEEVPVGWAGEPARG